MSGGSRRKTEAIVQSVAEGLLSHRSDGLSVDRVEFVSEGGRWFLRVFLDHPAGVTLQHCQEVTRALDEVLDRIDPIPHAYNLEVSSPGLERPLLRDSDYDRFTGRLVTLRLYRAIGGRKVVTGRLAGLTPGGEVMIQNESGGEIGVPRVEIARAHLAVDWADAGRDVGGGGR